MNIQNGYAYPALRGGFSLIELIAGIVAFSIVMVIVSTLVINQTRQSITPILQTRAAELAQSLAAEIMAKAYDEQSSLSDGLQRCGDTGGCTAAGDLGPDGESSRDAYDDVDDYHGLDEAGSNIKNALNETLEHSGKALYEGFRAQVSVSYDADFDGNADTSAGSVKLVKIVITTSGGDAIPFAFHRRDF